VSLPVPEPEATAVRRLRLHVGGWRDPAAEAVTEVRNPADTRELVALAPRAEPAALAEAIMTAREAAGPWGRTSALARGAILAGAAEAMAGRADEIAAGMTREMGKVIGESRAEVARAIEVLRFFSQAPKLQAGSTFPLPASDETAFSMRLPLGAVGLITPWNFPLAIPTWKAAAALAFGNTVVLKPAELAPLSATALTESLLEGGLPSEVMSLVLGPGAQLGAGLVAAPEVAGVSFTGSTAVGRDIERAAAGTGKRIQCEMGGRNAIVVMADADIDAAVEAIVLAGFGTTGQRCTSSSRVIVERTRAGELVDRLVARSKALAVGPGLEPGTDVGPLVSERQLDEVIEALERALDEGAELLAGGERIQDGACRHGHFMEPAVVRVPAESWFAGHEVFGPVVSVFEADDFDHALRLNNSVDYGLSSAIFTRSLASAMRFVHETDTGMVYVNRPTTGAEPHIPFGGAKSSSIGPPEMGSAWQFYTRSRSAHVNWGEREGGLA
jgi:alpha-ketoglutaric semialdehyde dehydrogenase